MSNSIEKWRTDGVFPAPTTPVSAHPSPMDYMAKDLRLIYHMCQLTLRLEKSGDAHMLAAGTADLPVFLQLSLSQPCVRHAILGLAAFHLSWLTKSIELDFAGYEYRRSAYAELRKAVQSFSKENADAILAASIMLCWQAPDTKEYAKVMGGIAAVMEAMRPWSQDSLFRARFEPVRIEDISSDVTPDLLDDAVSSETSTFRPLVKGLASLTLHAVGESEVCRAVRGLSDFVQNLHIRPPGPTAEDQYKAYFPSRSFISWMPSAFLRMDNRDPLILMFQAYYHAVSLAVEPLFPKAAKAIFTDVRAHTLRRILAEVKTGKLLGGKKRRPDWDALLRVPHIYLLDYHLRHQKAATSQGNEKTS